MRNTDITEVLENCLRRIDAGTPIESVVAEYPDQAAELRELLRIAAAAQPASSAGRIPANAQIDSRRRMLARAKELQGKRPAASLSDILRFIRTHLGTAALTGAAVALLFIALSSTNALPGDELYPVKMAAERAGISLASNETTRLEREAGFDMRRAEEVAQMIRNGQSGAVSFGGFLKVVPAVGWQIAGVQLEIPAGMQQQTASRSEMFVEITGNLTNQGIVQVETLEPKLFTVRGAIDSIGVDGWMIDGQLVRITADTRISGSAQPGRQVAIQAARVIGSDHLLALNVEVLEDLAAPAVQETPTATSTQTPAASATPQKIQMPTITPESSDDSGSGDGKEEATDTSDNHSGDETDEPADNHEDEPSHKSTDSPGEDSHSEDSS